jgi:hypothetical protein
MAQFVIEILDGDRAGEVVPLADRSLRIGRKPTNDLVLSDEKTSGVHAEIAVEGDRYVLRDLGSTNGTFLDGRRVTEVVLTPGDAFLIGRVKVRFRAEGAEPAPAGGEGLVVGRIDQSRLRGARGGRSVALLLVLLLAAGGAAGYLFWQRQAGGEGVSGGSAAQQGPRPPLEVRGNKAAGADCEGEVGWTLRAAGLGFQPGGRAHTGNGSLEALRVAGTAGEVQDFAVAASKDAVPVLTGRTLTVAAFVRTEGGGEGAVRMHFFSSAEGSPFHFRTGTPLTRVQAFERQSAAAVVPAGCDRCAVELVAVLPQDGAAVAFDDVALLEEGEAEAVSLKLDESMQTLVGAGSALAIRSTDPEQPAVLLEVLPDEIAPAHQGLHKAGLLAASDVGFVPRAAKAGRAFQLAWNGKGAWLVFPAESAAGLAIAGQELAFAGVSAESQFEARQLLLGAGGTRCLVQLAAPIRCEGRLGGGRYRLHVPAESVELVMSFREERQQAAELLRTAQANVAEGEPGKALDALRDLQRSRPHDSEVLGRASALRGELLAGLADRLRGLETDLGEAQFFETRGGFQRVVLGIDEVTALYGERNLEDPAAVQRLRADAAAQLQKLDAERASEREHRLDAMAKAFADAGQQDLASMVRDYLARTGGK